MKRCIVNVAVGGNYAAVGQPRLVESIKAFGKDVAMLTWTNEYPAESPTEEESPRAFKLYAIREAYNRGYEQVLWLDATAYLIGDIEPIWQSIGDRGYYFVGWGGTLGAVAPAAGLEICQVSEPEAKKIDLVLAGCWGVDFSKDIGRAVFQYLCEMERRGAHVGPDGRDETPMSVMVHRWGLWAQKQPAWFNTWEHKGGSLIQFCGV